KEMLAQAAHKLRITISGDFSTIEEIADPFTIQPGTVSAKSGHYAYHSFTEAVSLAHTRKVDAICTLPIHKKAWELAGVTYKGHTDALRDIFDKEAIMMLGCPKMYVALYTEHIPLKEVAVSLSVEKLTRFLVDFHRETQPETPVAVLGLNPHAGDNGVLGSEEEIIVEAMQNAASQIGKPLERLFSGPVVPDVAFTPVMRSHYTHFVAMYHDQGLAPLKALYFEESINVSLNLPIVRTSVDHGTAFDIAYRGKTLNAQSYINAIHYIKEMP
ncbi:MAG TPA: 4-hydroxythreonine-4-phosphate dehydrogenase, partial [Epsilonproteobacteria bacterium]|nr:4-hydroxythreonine-4-phosphate dehydrogenase [Campylobacterota bacterium]